MFSAKDAVNKELYFLCQYPIVLNKPTNQQTNKPNHKPCVKRQLFFRLGLFAACFQLNIPTNVNKAPWVNTAYADDPIEVITIVSQITGHDSGHIVSFWAGGGRNIPNDPTNFDFLTQIRPFDEPKSICKQRNHMVEVKKGRCKSKASSETHRGYENCATINNVTVHGELGASGLVVEGGFGVGSDFQGYQKCIDQVDSSERRSMDICESIGDVFTRDCD